MIVELLTDHHLEFLSLKGGCRGSSESTHVKMPNSLKFHVAAQMTPSRGRQLFYPHLAVFEKKSCLTFFLELPITSFLELPIAEVGVYGIKYIITSGTIP